MKRTEAAWLADTPVGNVLILTRGDQLLRVVLNVEKQFEEALDEIAPGAAPSGEQVTHIAGVFSDYFSGRDFLSVHNLHLAAEVFSSPFCENIYRHLREVPLGSTITYGELARRSGCPGMARAVGRLMSRNPVPISVPCHRVVPASGGLGHFSGGVELKRILLQLERGPWQHDELPG